MVCIILNFIVIFFLMIHDTGFTAFPFKKVTFFLVLFFKQNKAFSLVKRVRG